jgi:hypothetical protein
LGGNAETIAHQNVIQLDRRLVQQSPLIRISRVHTVVGKQHISPQHMNHMNPVHTTAAQLQYAPQQLIGVGSKVNREEQLFKDIQNTPPGWDQPSDWH